jgi:integrase
MAVEILTALPRFDGAHIFSTTGGKRPVSGYSKAKLRIEQEINKALAKDGGEPLTNWQIHDLRRTAASGMAKLGVPIDHIGRVLNHAPRGITATVYDKHSYMPEKRRALDLWCAHLGNLIQPEPGNVVPIRGAS